MKAAKKGLYGKRQTFIWQNLNLSIELVQILSWSKLSEAFLSFGLEGGGGGIPCTP
jgi:hypothetical protein